MYSNRRPTHRVVRNAAIDPSGNMVPTNGGPSCRSDVTVPGCGSVTQPFCDVQMTTGVVRNVAASAVAALIMAPRRTNYFQPLFEKLAVIDSSNPDVNRRIEIQQIEINQIPQEPFSDTIAAGNTAAALSDFFGPDFDEYGKPVSYGIYSQTSLLKVFQYGLLNIEGVAIDAYAVHFGNALDQVPPFLKVGQPFTEQ